ncbi:MAG: hypothetical protein QNJ54_25555 [Prochloraceae cyanobacterium]|nr:hypothetical protein [Prochloraceae cyanobacterium]
MATNFLKNYRHPKVVVIQPGYGVTGNAVINADTLSLPVEKRIIDTGFFVAQVRGNSRILPRSKTAEAAAIGATSIKLDPFSVFIPGDTIGYVESFAVLTPSLYQVGQEFNLIADGVKAKVLIPAPTANVGTFLANAINTSRIKSKVYAFSNAPDFDTLWLVAKEPSVIFPVRTENVNTVGTFIEDTIIAPADDPIATIQSINAETGEIFLTAPLTVDLEPNIKVGVEIEGISGLITEEYSLRSRPFVNVTLTTSNPLVYTENLPYMDEEIRKTFNNLYFNN